MGSLFGEKRRFVILEIYMGWLVENVVDWVDVKRRLSEKIRRVRINLNSLFGDSWMECL